MASKALPAGLIVRELTESDPIADLTRFLHTAYAPLARQGLRYVATDQDDATTRRRIAGGSCLLAIVGGRLVGTIAVARHKVTDHSSWYARPDIAYCSQLGVDPASQGLGIGSLLMDLVEERAWAAGAGEIALDTAEPAEHLVAWYTRRGYRPVERVSWPATNYDSVVLSKDLSLPRLSVRGVRRTDEPILQELLVECMNWDPARPRMTREDVLARPELRRYVEGWGRAGDDGIVATNEAGVAIGAAWRRDYDGAGMPEASIAVRRPWRRHGVGDTLLAEIERRARQAGIDALSLTVEQSNPAASLYLRRGYRVVSGEQHLRTMVLDIVG